jgi:drug/metabolite transporter (DMT)-like permease
MSRIHPLILALLAAILFGASAPTSRVLLGSLTPFQLAGFLYLGAALGVVPFVVRRGRTGERAQVSAKNRLRLAFAVLSGGILAPVLLLFALQLTSAGSVSLLLNLEMVATAILAVAFFGEHLGRRGWIGVSIIVAAGVLLSLGGGRPGLLAGTLAACACICWAWTTTSLR